MDTNADISDIPERPSRKRKKRHKIWFLQWNCRGLHSKLAELKLRLEILREEAPDVILLQEAYVKDVKVRNYNIYSQPSMLRQGEVPCATLTLVRKYIPQVQLDTVHYCGDNREVVSVRLKLESIIVDVINVYIRPGVNENDFSWLRRTVNPSTPTIVAGNFNAMPNLWGYEIRNTRGKELKATCEALRLQLYNDKGAHTRLSQHDSKTDTSPDLT
ncbi:hypothetical protein HPB47_023224 [Ixodes persulcatus]|uniref:Uncharacterized protein n=1 Tax=Ixodes persulcatus TaxID=34615 RepID=A0AC60QAQ2_IXOPE|nr:hypothetical protein HPB47_023224 [Ixodes persulcatus]